eukprot:CAMPEP_0170086680 /NCGR_PEP_ID=MMETSP0019_2-20121128/21299_1 /TAXON_ID=98059 /ORGANISM="Dinobryon sp., Strain UTEXLB2267" /LENGTH=140 /DNA_ID=CAMNT_0010303855 /DNA_START=497 /DNA_END=919 /DNA_ORIENTATION=+
MKFNVLDAYRQRLWKRALREHFRPLLHNPHHMQRAAALTLSAAESAINGFLQEFQEETPHAYFASASSLLSEEELLQQELTKAAELEAIAAAAKHKRRMSKAPSRRRSTISSPTKPLMSPPSSPELPLSTSPGKQRSKKL